MGKSPIANNHVNKKSKCYVFNVYSVCLFIVKSYWKFTPISIHINCTYLTWSVLMKSNMKISLAPWWAKKKLNCQTKGKLYCRFVYVRSLALILYSVGPRVNPHTPSSETLATPGGGENRNFCVRVEIKRNSSFMAISLPRQWRRPEKYG